VPYLLTLPLRITQNCSDASDVAIPRGESVDLIVAASESTPGDWVSPSYRPQLVYDMTRQPRHEDKEKRYSERVVFNLVEEIEYGRAHKSPPRPLNGLFRFRLAALESNHGSINSGIEK
jgi:hypothetical protein